MPFWILDAIIVVVLLIIILIGYKVGLLPTIVKLVSSLGGLVIALILTEPVTNTAIDLGLDDGLSNKIISNIQSADAYALCADPATAEEGYQKLLTELGVPDFLSGLFSKAISESVNIAEAAQKVADGISRVVTTVVVFLVLLFFSSIVFWIIKAIINKIRKEVTVIRVVDGILGGALFGVAGLLLVYIFLLVSSLIMQSNTNEFTEFMQQQLHLSDDIFGIAKYLYLNNIVGNFIALFM